MGLNHLPSGRFAANGAWLAVQVMAHNLAPMDGADRPGRADRNHQDPPAAALLYHRTDHPLGTSPHFASAPALALGSPVQWRPGTAASHSTPSLTTRRQLARHPANRTSPQTRASPVRERLFPCPISPSRSSQPLQAAIGAPKSACRPPAKPPICPNGAQDISPVAPSPLFRCPSVDSGLATLAIAAGGFSSLLLFTAVRMSGAQHQPSLVKPATFLAPSRSLTMSTNSFLRAAASRI